MQAADVMTFGAASIRADASMEEAARLMLQHCISGVPVVDGEGDLVGMVPLGDLLRRERTRSGAGGWSSCSIRRSPLMGRDWRTLLA